MACERATALLSAITEVKKHGARTIPAQRPDLTKGATLASFLMESSQVIWATRRSCWYTAGPR